MPQQTKFRVSYWLQRTDRQPDGTYNPSQSATVSVYLATQTLLFENMKAQDITRTKNLEDLLGSIYFVLEQQLKRSDFIIHKIWIP